MKIAYHRYNQNTDLDFAIASVASRNTEERLGVLEAMVELGHEVTITSWVPARHRHALNGESKSDVFDNSWMTALKWDLDPDMDEFDLLMIETASANTMYAFRDPRTGESLSYVGHMADILRKSKGIPIVIFHVGMKDLAFPFQRLSCLREGITEAERKQLSSNNYRNLFWDIDIWDGYEYTLWCKASRIDAFLQAFHGHYGREEVHIARYIATPLGYSPRYDPEHPSRTPGFHEFDLVYVGRADRKERIERIQHYYDNPYQNALLVGKGWENMEWEHDVTAPGQSKFHGDVYDHYKRGLGCVLVLDRELAEGGMATTRHIQAIRAGCIAMVDELILDGVRWVGDEEFVVSTPEEVEEILVRYDDPDDFQEVNQFQKDNLPRWQDFVQDVLDVGVGLKEGVKPHE